MLAGEVRIQAAGLLPSAFRQPTQTDSAIGFALAGSAFAGA